MFRGSYTALITPFRQGKIDYDAFEKLIEWQIEQGSHGVVICGTTGESPTLPHDEHNAVIERAVQIVAGRIGVIAGTGSNATAEAINLTRHAQEAGADAALLATPYYNKPTQEGIYQHYKAIHDATDIPMILYNIPGRSVVNVTDETIARLAKLPRIAGNKDATGDLSRPASLRAAIGKDAEDFIQLSGEDGTAVEFNELGGVGCISVTSNIVPKACAELQEACLAGEFDRARKMQDALMPLHEVMFCESSPGPVKYAASLMGLCSDEMRLPLVLPSEENKARIKAVLEVQGLV